MFNFQLLSRSFYLGLIHVGKIGKKRILKLFLIKLLIQKILPSLLTVNCEFIKG